MTVRKIFTNEVKPLKSRERVIPLWESFSINAMPLSEIEQHSLKKVLEIGVLCNNAYLKQHPHNTWKIIGDPTEGAILSAAAKAGIWKEVLEKDFTLAFEIPFDSERKKMSTVRGSPLLCSFVKKALPISS
ncbi:MAG: hypothetical protein U0586_16550 [Candidatus Brocadiaceae bacterium]